MAALQPTTDQFPINGTTKSANAQVIHLSGAASVKASLGEWASVAPLFTAAGSTMPAGVRTIGSNGHTYKLTGSAWANDPTTDGGANWTDETPAAGGTSATNISGSLSGNNLNISSSSGTGASIDLSALANPSSLPPSGAAGGALSGNYPSPTFNQTAFNTAAEAWAASRTLTPLTV